MENKTVDVIIPAYHPGKEFATLIKRLEKQSVPIHRIIVMNTEESMWNKEWEKLSDVMEIHHLAKSEFDHGGTRAQAAELSAFIMLLTSLKGGNFHGFWVQL